MDVKQMGEQVRKLQALLDEAADVIEQVRYDAESRDVNLGFSVGPDKQFFFTLPMRGHTIAPMLSEYKATLNEKISMLRRQIADAVVGEVV